MKKAFLFIALSFLLLIVFAPFFAKAQGLVPCDGPNCTIASFFKMLAKIYDFIVKDIATPLAVISLTIGGMFILVSAGNPNLMSRGKQIIYISIIGLILVWCSWLIINTILCVGLKYCDWNVL